MGQHEIRDKLEGGQLRLFLKRLLDDLFALERMLKEGLFESGVQRIGVEQELFLADEAGHPIGAAMEVLEHLDDDHFTTELGLFNLEINLDPLVFTGDCLSRMEADLHRFLEKARVAARACDADTVLSGILPSLRQSDMNLENMTPLPRYAALNNAMRKLRRGPIEFHIKGVDELTMKHDSVMLEACNASFQIHLQVSPDNFTRLYNAAQLLAAPVLAAASNSPLLFGRRLWQETRIALFQQATDTRASHNDRSDAPARGHFGRNWLEGTVVDLFKQDITRFRALFGSPAEEDPIAKLDEGTLPALRALCLHNGTIWRWNRPCYGITDGKPHLRLENRILPSGPTVVDQVANAAFWFGLMTSPLVQETDFVSSMPFESVKENFIAASRQGLNAQLTWVSGEALPAPQLIQENLLDQAREGLLRSGLDTADIDRYLGIISDRVSSGRTGSRWILQSLAAMKGQGTATERLSALTRATITRQIEGSPVHQWTLAERKEAGGWKRHYMRVEQYMTTDLFIVREDDPLEFVANMMDWERIRHVPVVDEDHQLVGLVTYRALLRALAHGTLTRDGDPVPVSSIMRTDLKTISPETETLAAIEIMRKNSVGCLPIIRAGRLLGIVTERDFMVLTRELLFQKLKE